MGAYLRCSGPAGEGWLHLGLVVAGEATACVRLERYLGQNGMSWITVEGKAGEKNTRMVGLLSR